MHTPDLKHLISFSSSGPLALWTIPPLLPTGQSLIASTTEQTRVRIVPDATILECDTWSRRADIRDPWGWGLEYRVPRPTTTQTTAPCEGLEVDVSFLPDASYHFRLFRYRLKYETSSALGSPNLEVALVGKALANIVHEHHDFKQVLDYSISDGGLSTISYVPRLSLTLLVLDPLKDSAAPRDAFGSVGHMEGEQRGTPAKLQCTPLEGVDHLECSSVICHDATSRRLISVCKAPHGDSRPHIHISLLSR